MFHFSASDGPNVKDIGTAYVKKPNPVYMVQITADDFTVETSEGLLTGNQGDYLVYDPMSGNVWPVSREYFEMHYSLAGWSGGEG